MAKLIALYKTFRGGEWFEASLESVRQQIDGVVAVQSTSPWLVSVLQEENCIAPLQKFKAEHPEIPVVSVTGLFANQTAQYELGLKLIRQHFGEDAHVLVIDTDEVWADDDIAKLARKVRNGNADYYVTKLWDYVKSPVWRVDNKGGPYVVALGSPNPPAKLRGRFNGIMGCSVKRVSVMRFHHFTYVRQDESELGGMMENTAKEDGQYIPNWVEDVWTKLPKGENLHPSPRCMEVWPRIQQVPEDYLPEAVFRVESTRQMIQKFRRMYVTHTDILNALIEARGYRSYLEIGVRNPADNFDLIRAPVKVGVDPSEAAGVVCQTADEFFASNRQTWDLILVDGDHRWVSAFRDVGNALPRLNQGGAVVMHDVYPTCLKHSQLVYDNNKPGNGTAWKAYALLRMSRPDLSMQLIGESDGIGVITHGSQELFVPPDTTECPSLEGPDHELTWDFFVNYRRDLLRPITKDQFLQQLKEE